jgi:hypothetical protein
LALALWSASSHRREQPHIDWRQLLRDRFGESFVPSTFHRWEVEHHFLLFPPGRRVACSFDFPPGGRQICPPLGKHLFLVLSTTGKLQSRGRCALPRVCYQSWLFSRPCLSILVVRGEGCILFNDPNLYTSKVENCLSPKLVGLSVAAGIPAEMLGPS